jgi:hypothetical protein
MTGQKSAARTLFDFVNPQAFVPGGGLSLAGSRGRKKE